MEHIIHLYAIKCVYSRTSTRSTEGKKMVKTQRNSGHGKEKEDNYFQKSVFVISYDPFDYFTDMFFGPSSYLNEPSD